MNEETCNTICTAFVSTAVVACLFLLTRCAIEYDRTGEARRMEDLKKEERLDAERIKAGLEYVSQGSWIKRQSIEPQN